MHNECVVSVLSIEAPFWGFLGLCQSLKEKEAAGLPGLVLSPLSGTPPRPTEDNDKAKIHFKIFSSSLYQKRPPQSHRRATSRREPASSINNHAHYQASNCVAGS